MALAGGDEEARRAAQFYSLNEDRALLHLHFMHGMGRRPKSPQETTEELSELEDMAPGPRKNSVGSGGYVSAFGRSARCKQVNLW